MGLKWILGVMALSALLPSAFAFVAPARVLTAASSARRLTARGAVNMNLESVTSLLVAASRFAKDVPSTLNEMSQAVTEGGAAIPDEVYQAAAAAQEATEELSRATPELPPPYVLVVFAAVLFGLAGVQQLSLGDVFDEEEKSASASGAVARRQNMRERSFFKAKRK